MYSNPLLSGTLPDSLGSLSQSLCSSGAVAYLDLLIHSNPSLSLLMHSNPLLSGTVPDSLGRASASFSASPQPAFFRSSYMHSNPLLSGGPAHSQQPFAERASESSISLCT
eukprot:TRINITY_DN2008_c0_g1_i68.p2 TRINITY_DN2008_c0_g1~~TRINITY_DN2008_c0_g1_i68.p2  ORF type:complete len:111 (+),score=15.84 TRINITY_DN2008_c0_g1_i68:489-821(+)